jgi:hypothetical protein
MGISTGLWQSLSPDLWAFYISELPKQPQWKITPDAQLVEPEPPGAVAADWAAQCRKHAV